MIQPWLTVAGIVLDFAGFMLLLREWWLAFFNEGRQMLLAEQLDRMQDESTIRNARAEHRAAMSARRGAFLLASTLVVAGFLLQLAGAWPL